MRYCIPVRGDRIAPRCTTAEGLLFVSAAGSCTDKEALVPLRDQTWLEITELLVRRRVDTLVCGGLSRESRSALADLSIGVVDNVAATVSEVLRAITSDSLCPGYGLEIVDPVTGAAMSSDLGAPSVPWDCLSCDNRVCLEGRDCRGAPAGSAASARRPIVDTARLIEATHEIAVTHEHAVSRLTELLTFCRKMEFCLIGVAYCMELEEPARILVDGLRPHLKPVPVCCKIGGLRAGQDASADVICNPVAQAETMNRFGCDLNVAFGLCMGADCLFTRASRAPATTMFVKDRSLVHDPIGAMYLEYPLGEAKR